MSEAPLSFELSEDQAKALRSLAGGKGIRISGYVDGTTLKVDNIAINAGIIGISSSPFKDGMAPFIALAMARSKLKNDNGLRRAFC